MPTYEYKCDACGVVFEKFQSITAAPIKKCEKCGKSQVRRLIGTGAGLIFKGSGFYITDYRSESYRSAAKSDSGGSAAATSNGSGNGAAIESGSSAGSTNASTSDSSKVKKPAASSASTADKK